MVKEHTKCTGGVVRLVVQLVVEACGDTQCHLGESNGGCFMVYVPLLTCCGRQSSLPCTTSEPSN